MPTLVGREVGHAGYGLMRMTWVAQPPPQEQCFETLNTALKLGANFWNGGELYGTPAYNSLHLLNKYFTQYPGKGKPGRLEYQGRIQVGPARSQWF